MDLAQIVSMPDQSAEAVCEVLMGLYHIVVIDIDIYQN